jgi:hypothetical protein
MNEFPSLLGGAKYPDLRSSTLTKEEQVDKVYLVIDGVTIESLKATRWYELWEEGRCIEQLVHFGTIASVVSKSPTDITGNSPGVNSDIFTSDMVLDQISCNRCDPG